MLHKELIRTMTAPQYPPKSSGCDAGGFLCGASGRAHDSGLTEENFTEGSEFFSQGQDIDRSMKRDFLRVGRELGASRSWEPG